MTLRIYTPEHILSTVRCGRLHQAWPAHCATPPSLQAACSREEVRSHISPGRLDELATQPQFCRFAAYMGLEAPPRDPLRDSFRSFGFDSTPSVHSGAAFDESSISPEALVSLRLVRHVCCQPFCDCMHEQSNSFAELGVASDDGACRAAFAGSVC